MYSSNPTPTHDQRLVVEEIMRFLRDLGLQLDETTSPQTNTTAISQNLPTVTTYKASESENNGPGCSKAEETLETYSKPAPSLKTSKIPKPIKVERNNDIVIDILKSFAENTAENTEIIKSGKVYLLKELAPIDFDYRRNLLTFDSSMSCAKKPVCKSRKCHKIVKVCCPYLVAHFNIRKEKKRRLDGYVFESEVYHGTKNANIASICKENFDWRKSGTHVGTKFGRGVSFAKYPTYATFYPKSLELPRVMLVTKIMYVRKQIGRTGMTVPDDIYDTTTNAKEEVIVKYDDAEFLPLFIIYYL